MVQEKSTLGEILVVDDGAYFRSLLVTSLRDAGFQCRGFEEGRKLLDYYEGPHPEVSAILLDLLMPGLSGLETLKALRKLDRKVPVIVMISPQHRKYALECANYGIAGIVSKPLDAQELMVQLHELLELDEQAQAESVQRLKVLIVEKNYPLSCLMKEVLEKKYFEVRLTTFYEDLEPVCNEFSPDLVICQETVPQKVSPDTFQCLPLRSSFSLVTYRNLPPAVTRRKKGFTGIDYRLPCPLTSEALISELYALGRQKLGI